MLALHGILEPVCRKDLLAQRTTAKASAHLQVVGAVIVRVIGLLTEHDSIFDQSLVYATTAAHFPTRRRNPCPLTVLACRPFFGRLVGKQLVRLQV